MKNIKHHSEDTRAAREAGGGRVRGWKPMAQRFQAVSGEALADGSGLLISKTEPCVCPPKRESELRTMQEKRGKANAVFVQRVRTQTSQRATST